jgi:glycosyltransferase involved in cell wall biosynthesis
MILGNNEPSRICVIVPCYNSSKTILRTLESLKENLSEADTIFLYDDASRDGTVSKIDTIENVGPKIVIESGHQNHGAGYARNVGLKYAYSRNFKYIAFCDADDSWHDTKIKTQLHYLSKYDFVSSGALVIKENIIRRQVDPLSTSFTANDLVAKKILCTCSSVIFKMPHNKVFFPENRRGQDFLFWIELLKRNDFSCYNVSEPLVNYYLSSDSLSSNKLRKAFLHWNLLRKSLKMPYWKTVCYYYLYLYRSILRRL